MSDDAPTTWAPRRPFERVREAVDFLAARLAEPPRVAVILGSGLGGFTAAVQGVTTFAYRDIPRFPVPHVEGHAGCLTIGRLGATPVAVFAGRLHCYEGYQPAEVALPVRVAVGLGCQVLIVTNAAGGLNPAYQPGDLMVIVDHLSLPGLAGWSPLIAAEPEFGTGFVDLTDAYDPGLADLALAAAAEVGEPVHRGVYAWVIGPNYETPAETRALQLLGADAVGMSTVPEVVVARQAGMRVLGVSLITNVAGGVAGKVSHEEVLERARIAGPRLSRLTSRVLARLSAE